MISYKLNDIVAWSIVDSLTFLSMLLNFKQWNLRLIVSTSQIHSFARTRVQAFMVQLKTCTQPQNADTPLHTLPPRALAHARPQALAHARVAAESGPPFLSPFLSSVKSREGSKNSIPLNSSSSSISNSDFRSSFFILFHKIRPPSFFQKFFLLLFLVISLFSDRLFCSFLCRISPFPLLRFLFHLLLHFLFLPPFSHSSVSSSPDPLIFSSSAQSCSSPYQFYFLLIFLLLSFPPPPCSLLPPLSFLPSPSSSSASSSSHSSSSASFSSPSSSSDSSFHLFLPHFFLPHFLPFPLLLPFPFKGGCMKFMKFDFWILEQEQQRSGKRERLM